jgi:hypothetical protein
MACPQHPDYLGNEVPPVHCVDCWFTWIMSDNERYARIVLALAHSPGVAAASEASPFGSLQKPQKRTIHEVR